MRKYEVVRTWQGCRAQDCFGTGPGSAAVHKVTSCVCSVCPGLWLKVMVLLSVLPSPQRWCCVQLQGWCVRECGFAVGWGLGWEMGVVGAGSDQPVHEQTKWSVAISAKGWTRGGPGLWGSLNPTRGHKYGKGKSSKGPKADESGRRLWVVGDWSRRCVSGVQGSSASQAWGREDLSMVPTPGRWVGWWQCPGFPGGVWWRRESAQGAARKVPIAQLQSTEQESRQLVVLLF